MPRFGRCRNRKESSDESTSFALPVRGGCLLRRQFGARLDGRRGNRRRIRAQCPRSRLRERRRRLRPTRRASYGSCIPPLLCPTITNSREASKERERRLIRTGFTVCRRRARRRRDRHRHLGSPQFSYSGRTAGAGLGSASRWIAAPRSTSCSPWPATRPSSRSSSSMSVSQWLADPDRQKDSRRIQQLGTGRRGGGHPPA